MSTFDAASRPPVVDSRGFWRYAARIVNWTDGDTAVVDCLVDLGFEEMATKRRRIRLVGVNTPEKNSKDAQERVAAGRATRYAESLAPVGTVVDVLVEGYDKYGGRDDGHVFTTGDTPASIASLQIMAGYGVPYDGGAR